MAKLSRYFLSIFGASGPTDDFEKFGSARAGAPVKTKSIPDIQALAAWLTGLKAGIITDNRAPFMESVNGILYLITHFLAYGLQEGIPEWDSQTEYHTGSIVKKTSTMELYVSRINTNVGQALPSKTDNANWRYLNHSFEAPGIIKAYGGSVPPSGYLFCDGSLASRSTYADLFAAIGTAWGAGDGSTTFALPDLRGKTLFGKTGGGTFVTLGSSGGAENHGHTQSAHGHTVNNHGHSIGADGNHGHTLQATTGAVGGGVGFVRILGGQLHVYGVGGGFINDQATPYTDAAGNHAHGGGTGGASPGTDSTAPAITNASNLPPYAVVNYIIKY